MLKMCERKENKDEAEANNNGLNTSWKMWKCLGNLLRNVASCCCRVALSYCCCRVTLPLLLLLLLLQFVELDKSLGNVYAKSKKRRTA